VSWLFFGGIARTGSARGLAAPHFVSCTNLY
jgi:hypothetical protein